MAGWIERRARKGSKAGDQNSERGHLDAEQSCDFVNRECGRELAGSDLNFGLSQFRTNGCVTPQARGKSLLEHRPHPFYLLVASPRCQFAGGSRLRFVRKNLRPKSVDAAPCESGISNDRR